MCCLGKLGIVEFQFHKGTIKAGSNFWGTARGKLFQFHKGTIKAFGDLGQTLTDAHFNSIKVQLKPKGLQ